MAREVTELDDIQAILRSGFGTLGEACFLLIRITDVREAKAWLAAVANAPGAEKLPYEITHARHLDDYQEKVLQIAFTAQGLLKLEVPGEVFPDECFEGAPGGHLHTFSPEFYFGMARGNSGEDAQLRLLGDTGENAPSKWYWGSPDHPEHMPDILIMLYAETGGLAAFRQMVEADLANGFEVFHTLHAAGSPGDGRPQREPFGFIDGISQPQIDWQGSRKPGSANDADYTNLIAAGEFLLGYPNEYNLYTYRPLVDTTRDPGNLLAPAEDYPGKRDFARNGSYVVFRQLEQDVAGFWRFVSEHSHDGQGVSLAEAMVGRRLANGDPLVPASRAAILGSGEDSEDVRQNGFVFDSDPDGLMCPFGAHIRRANPRTGDLPGGRQGFVSKLLRALALKRGGPREDLLSSARFHRIIRRGRAFGSPLSRESALEGEESSSKGGIYFIALNANLSRQFEFVQNAWIVNSKFNALDGEADPLIGNREETPLGLPTDAFTLSEPAGPSRRICGLPQFVTMRGGAYFFLPGLRAVRYIARQSDERQEVW
jgi:Dyp-type peroxidase family